MNNSVSIYSITDGQLTGVQLIGTAGHIKANTPEGCAAIEGHHDHLSSRVDLKTKTIIPYQPPQPSTAHDWDGTSLRWIKRADVMQREEERGAAIRQLRELEQRSLRPLRELALNPGDSEARQQLSKIEERITALRQVATLPDIA